MKNQILNNDVVDDCELWAEMKAGDEKAFSTLFKRYYSYLIQYGNSFSPHSEKIQDCVQDVFTDIWVYRNSLSDTVVVKAYLLSCVRKRIVRLQQRDKVFNKAKSVDAIAFLFDFSVEHQLISDELTAGKVAHLNKLLNVLPARQKEALYLRYHHGLNVDQIAGVLNVNYQSANNLLHRALVNIRKEWKGNMALLLMLLAHWI
ncbi:sigma-70 family RNA polymerase sigma factor [Flavobacterium sufflavum]|uniref:Sigma-70 family RNA polymerase sigma factor n=1 Tax=Flavobacterium sufflavum TaxID=1921138 RepID=A0A437KNP2_9FLAO|nr:sigma-70 family RNA polymerase sigma factor [Flavobacterium sufflavum]RVT73088.1 sigma-70 family RNA polymerase sigma factor [Flavobacterium sufflavum]